MKKIPQTSTNEARTNIINSNCAKFRANTFEVVLIINIFDLDDRPQHITNTYVDSNGITYMIFYTVNRPVVPHHYDCSPENVCSTGIHYFNTIEPAYFYRVLPIDYTGVWKCWYETGQLMSECNYVLGERHGQCVMWHENGQKSLDCNYIDDKLVGKRLQWHPNGNILRKEVYANDKRIEIKEWTYYGRPVVCLIFN